MGKKNKIKEPEIFIEFVGCEYAIIYKNIRLAIIWTINNNDVNDYPFIVSLENKNGIISNYKTKQEPSLQSSVDFALMMYEEFLSEQN